MSLACSKCLPPHSNGFDRRSSNSQTIQCWRFFSKHKSDFSACVEHHEETGKAHASSFGRIYRHWKTQPAPLYTSIFVINNYLTFNQKTHLFLIR
jgi:hypothetical protein